MNVALVVPGGVDRSGKERVVPALLALIERLAQRHQVLVVAIRQEAQPSTYPLLGAQVVNLGLPVESGVASRLLLPLVHTRHIMAALSRARFRADVLHAIWISPTGLPTVLAARLLRKPSLLSIWAGELVWLPQIGYGGQGSLYRRTQINSALRWANGVSVGSRYVERQLLPWRTDAHWIPIGVNTAFFNGPVARAPGPPWRLLHVAGINRVKDPPTLLRALQIVAAQEPDVHLDWVGEDTLGGEAQRLAASLGIADRVTFHGFQPSEVVADLCARAHLYVQSSLHEGQGVSVLEAAACGVPTVGTEVGLVAELAPDAALATPPGDADALAAAILELLRDSARRETLGRHAQTWAQQYNADWTAARFETFYAELAG